MHQLLSPHPDSPSLAAARVEVAVTRPRADLLVLPYVVTGKMSDFRLPPVAAAARSDGLWQHTCFEAFVRAASGAAYYEFNFAPSTQWAAYRFDGYRSGMRVAPRSARRRSKCDRAADCYTLQASLELGRLSDLPREALVAARPLGGDRGRRAARKSYWALAHPPGKPDFHHADGFALELPRPCSA